MKNNNNIKTSIDFKTSKRINRGKITHGITIKRIFDVIKRKYNYFNGLLIGKQDGLIATGDSINVLRYKISIDRLIYIYHYGSNPRKIIYKDNNKNNKKIENFVKETIAENLNLYGRTSRQRIEHEWYNIKGVAYRPSVKKWRSRLKYHGQIVNFGYFDTYEQAATERLRGELQYFGKFKSAGVNKILTKCDRYDMVKEKMEIDKLNIREFKDIDMNKAKLEEDFKKYKDDKNSYLYQEIDEWKGPNEHISQEMFTNMVLTMAEVTNTMSAIGCAANQLNIPARFFISRFADTKEDKWLYYECINPQIIEVSDEKSYLYEGCLSFSGEQLRVKRYDKILAKWQTLENQTIESPLEGLHSRVFQHELDHLNGIVFHDRLTKIEKNISDRKLKKMKKRFPDILGA